MPDHLKERERESRQDIKEHILYVIYNETLEDFVIDCTFACSTPWESSCARSFIIAGTRTGRTLTG